LPGWKVGDKTGNGGYGTRNDIAIAWPATGSPVVIAIQSNRGSPAAPSDDALIADATKAAVTALHQDPTSALTSAWRLWFGTHRITPCIGAGEGARTSSPRYRSLVDLRLEVLRFQRRRPGPVACGASIFMAIGMARIDLQGGFETALG
jgi:hypothetical protein